MTARCCHCKLPLKFWQSIQQQSVAIAVERRSTARCCHCKLPLKFWQSIQQQSVAIAVERRSTSRCCHHHLPSRPVAGSNLPNSRLGTYRLKQVLAHTNGAGRLASLVPSSRCSSWSHHRSQPSSPVKMIRGPPLLKVS